MGEIAEGKKDRNKGWRFRLSGEIVQVCIPTFAVNQPTFLSSIKSVLSKFYPHFVQFGIQSFALMNIPRYTLWLFNIAMENGPFIDDFAIKTSIYEGFSMAMLNNQMVPCQVPIMAEERGLRGQRVSMPQSSSGRRSMLLGEGPMSTPTSIKPCLVVVGFHHSVIIWYNLVMKNCFSN